VPLQPRSTSAGGWTGNWRKRWPCGSWRSIRWAAVSATSLVDIWGLARPLQTALVSAVSFAVGAALPLGLTVLALMGSDTGDGADGQMVGAGGR
jgi:hypothetical protein